RTLQKNPGFTVVAVVTLALGMGANAAIFGLVDSAFLRGLPFREPDRLVQIGTVEPDHDWHTPTPTQYLAVRKESSSFEQVAAAGWADYFYDADDSVSQNLPGFLVTSNWLSTLGVQPLLGRDFREEEQIAGQDAVVMLSYDCWHTRFHADPQVAGKQIVLNRRPVTVIGVLPQSLGPYYQELEIFAPLVLARGVKRHREVAVRAALGCSRRPMIRQLLTESALLFLCGGSVAIVVTRWCEEIITKVASGMLPGAYLQVDTRVFLVSLGVSLVSALVFGMIPALQATAVNPIESLKDAAPNAAGGSHPRRMREVLIGAQVALGMVLLVGFGLLLRSFLYVESSPMGYDPRNVLTATLRLPATRHTAPSDRAR